MTFSFLQVERWVVQKLSECIVDQRSENLFYPNQYKKPALLLFLLLHAIDFNNKH